MRETIHIDGSEKSGSGTIVRHCLSLSSILKKAELKISKPGYVPIGRGILELEAKPIKGNLQPLILPEQGRIISIKGFAISSHLSERKVSRRMADSCNQALSKFGHEAEIEIIEDESADQKGAALFIYATTDRGCIIGSDMSGKLGRTAEFIGRSVACNLMDDIRSGATVDRFAADQLILYAALAEGESQYIIPSMNDHLDSNLWLIRKILGAKATLKDNHLKIHGIGLRRQ